MDLREETIRTYRSRAHDLSEFFNTRDVSSGIKAAFALAPRGKQRVVEVGCGNGRDAGIIIPKVSFYEGFDVAE